MIPELVAIFGVGAAASALLAWQMERRWIWLFVAIEIAIAVHELSFAFRGTREWIRLDLALTIPAFVLFNFGLTIYGLRKYAGFPTLILGLSAAVLPVWFLLFRVPG